MSTKKRYFIVILSITAALALLVKIPSVIAANDIHVYKSEHCGCCAKWIDHLSVNGFKTTFSNEDSMLSIKDKLGIPENTRSCHTGFITIKGRDYFLEGHIPADIIEKFIKNPPKNAIGLTVPGMPIGSPGMEVGTQKDYYEVLIVFDNGETKVYEKVNS